jgi:hypothetical protein
MSMPPKVIENRLYQVKLKIKNALGDPDEYI